MLKIVVAEHSEKTKENIIIMKKPGVTWHSVQSAEKSRDSARDFLEQKSLVEKGC